MYALERVQLDTNSRRCRVASRKIGFRETVCTAIVVSVLAGCQPAPQNPPDVAGPSSLMTWAADESTPAATVYRLGDLFAIFSNYPSGGSGSTTSNLQGMTCQGWLATPDGGQVPFLCNSADGQTGNVVIDGKSYDLSDGTLFFVTHGEEGFHVQQLSRDLASYDSSRTGIQKLIRTDTEIKELFDKATATID